MKTSYRKHWAPDGTVYMQRVTMSRDEFEHLSDAVEAEIAQNTGKILQLIFERNFKDTR